MFVLPGLIGNTQRNCFDGTAAAGGAFAVSYLSHFEDGTDASSYTNTITGGIGDPDALRKICVMFFLPKVDPAPTVTSVKITNIDGAGTTGEVTLSAVTGASMSTTNLTGYAYEGSVTSGSTADVAIVFSATVVRICGAVYRVINGTSSAGTGVGSVGSVSTLNRTPTIPSGGVGIFCAYTSSNADFLAWTNLTTEDYDAPVETTRAHSAGRRTTAGSTQVDCNATVAGTMGLLAVVYS